MKSTLLLATGLFLASAPAPDADDIAEMTRNFIVISTVDGQLSADESPGFLSSARLQADPAGSDGPEPGIRAEERPL